MHNTIFDTAIRSFDFFQFMQYMDSLIKNNTNQEDDYMHYTSLNFQRMKRWQKTFQPNINLIEKLKDNEEQQWWIITEPWCGDSAQSLPVIAALATAAAISLRIVLRDENPQIMKHYLTNDTKSIPILVSFDKLGKEIFKWGPRPEEAQSMMKAWQMHAGSSNKKELELKIHTWYTQNKGKSIQKELEALIS